MKRVKVYSILLVFMLTFAMAISPQMVEGNESVNRDNNHKTITKATLNLPTFFSKKAIPDVWNRKAITAYQFDSYGEFSDYMLTGGINYYTKEFDKTDKLVKISIPDPGIFSLNAACDANGKALIYDKNMKYIQSLDVSQYSEDEFIQIRAKAGDVYYLQLPDQLKEAMISTYVIRDNVSTYRSGDAFCQTGEGKNTYHAVKITKRCMASVLLDPIIKSGGKFSYTLQKKTGGIYKTVGYKESVGYEGDTNQTFSLKPGNYRIVLNGSKSQAVDVEFSAINITTKGLAYKKSKATNIKYNDYKENIYTPDEQASRWYKIQKTTTKSRHLDISGAGSGKGLKVSVYNKKKKKAIYTKTIRHYKDLTYKLPKTKGTYYIKISKNQKSVQGYYTIVFKK